MATLTIDKLTFPEQITLWSLRRWLADRSDWPVIRGELQRVCGGVAGYAAAQSLADVFDILARGGARTIGCHRLACRTVSPDEMLIIGMVSAARCGDAELGQRIAEELVRPPFRDRLGAACTIVAESFSLAGRPFGTPALMAASRAGSTLH